jgi:TPR repeat protein/tRNA A-37 threonylcarbamoyl transferase component Bud32
MPQLQTVESSNMIGQYELRELLGEGGIGQVHAAFDTVLERAVAIKSLRPELLNDKSFVDRFRGEATSLARLNHPNITTLYSLLPEGRNLYMVMELVRGDTLDALLRRRHGALGVQESLAIIAQAADGLSYAHSMGVIHRDIKPANLMITEAGLLKIMDFGIARVRGSQRLTRDGSMVGTLAYMAPEQLRGEPGDERSDLYSLGIVLYELLTGVPPFQANSDYELMQAQIHTRPQRLVSRVAGLDPRVDAALMRALSKAPGERFPSVRAFSDALGATALRVDAHKIVIEATRLISRSDLPAAVAAALPVPVPAKASFFDRFSFLPEGLRVPVVVGAATLVATGALAAGFLALMPSTVPAPASMAVASKGGPVASDGQASAGAPTSSAKPPAVTALPSESSTDKPKSPEASPPAAPDEEATTPRPTKTAMTAAIGRKDYAEAVRIARPLAEAGDRDAQFSMGVLYENGLELSQSDQEAAAWYRKAAEQGHVTAQFNLGAMYEEGRGVEKSMTQAFTWYRKAAEQGDAEAQNTVGVLYFLGEGVEQDDIAAVLWYEKAVKQSFAKAQKNLGDMYRDGRGLKQDDREALRLYYLAAEQKHAGAAFNIGRWYETGRGGQKPDYEAAARWYNKSAEYGNERAREAIEELRSKNRIKG